MKILKPFLLVFGFVTAGLATAWFGMGTTASANQQAPKLEIVSAAMKSQLAASDGSLEAKYEYWQDGFEQQKATIRYVRTRDMLLLERQLATQQTIESMDLAKKEIRKYHSTTAGTQTGFINNEPEGMLITQLTMDPLIRWVGAETLVEAVSRGSISPQPESIDGNSCWRIEIPGDSETGTRYILWVDPSIGYCSRKIQIERENQSPKVLLFRRYKEVGNGVWFPRYLSVEFNVPEDGKLPSQLMGDLVFHYRLTDVAVGVGYSKDKLTVTFPTGTEVIDKIKNATYTVP